MKTRSMVAVVVVVMLVIGVIAILRPKSGPVTLVQAQPDELEPYVKVEGIGSEPATFSKATTSHMGPTHQIRFYSGDYRAVGEISVFDASERGYGPPFPTDKLHIELRVTKRAGGIVTVSKNGERTDVVIEFVTRKAAEEWESTLSRDFSAYTSLSVDPTPSKAKLPLGAKKKDAELSRFP